MLPKSIRLICILFLVTLIAAPVFAQNARVQWIHNSGDIDANGMIVLMNGDTLFSNFQYRTATPFMDMAPGDHEFTLISTAINDVVGPITLSLADGGTYAAFINGITPTNIGLGKYFNPDTANRDISLNIFLVSDVREASTNPAQIELFAFHGSTDGPAVDAYPGDIPFPIINDLGYSENTPYLPGIDPGQVPLTVTDSQNADDVLGVFLADVTELAGASIVVFASGFVDPLVNEGGNRFAIFGALANGTVVELPDITPGEPGPWAFDSNQDYLFDGFVGADTLVAAGHGIQVDKHNRIWVGNFSSALRVVSPDGVDADFLSPISQFIVGLDTIPATGCRGLAADADGNILFARSAGDFVRVDVETGAGLDYWLGAGSLLKPAVDNEGFIYTGLVVGINPVTVLDPTTFAPTQEINLDGAPSFGRGLEVSADGTTIYTPDLGASGGPVYIWTSNDFVNYTKTDSIFNNTDGQPIFVTQRTTLDWGPDGRLWVSSDNAYAAGNNDPNGFVVLDFSDMSYQFLPSPEIAEGVGNGPRGAAFSVTGDTVYATYFNGNRLARFVKDTGTGVDDLVDQPAIYTLHQNYPNPFNPSTTIPFTLDKNAHVELKIFDNMGREVKTLVDKQMLMGTHRIEFEAKGLASGTYHYRISVNDVVKTREMILIK